MDGGEITPSSSFCSGEILNLLSPSTGNDSPRRRLSLGFTPAEDFLLCGISVCVSLGLEPVSLFLLLSSISIIDLCVAVNVQDGELG